MVDDTCTIYMPTHHLTVSVDKAERMAQRRAGRDEHAWPGADQCALLYHHRSSGKRCAYLLLGPLADQGEQRLDDHEAPENVRA